MSPRCAFPGCRSGLDGFPHGVCAPVCNCGAGGTRGNFANKRQVLWCHDFVYPEDKVVQADQETRAAVAQLTAKWPAGGQTPDRQAHQSTLVVDQLKEVIALAHDNGLHDAAQYITELLKGYE